MWLALMWFQSKDPKRDRLLLLLTYVGFAGIGMHMISGITLPAIFLFIMMADETKRKDWRLWIVGVCMASFMFNLSWFIIVSLISTAITFAMMFVRGKDQQKWRFCFWFSFLAVVGFSNHLYMPIRSALNPIIDEDHPVTWQAFTETNKKAVRLREHGVAFVAPPGRSQPAVRHRKQHGIRRVPRYPGFHSGVGENQKNFMEGNMPLGLLELLIYLLPTGFMLMAWYYYYRKNRNVAVLLILVTLLTTVVLVWYMNFADGTKPEHQDLLAWIRSGREGACPTFTARSASAITSSTRGSCSTACGWASLPAVSYVFIHK